MQIYNNNSPGFDSVIEPSLIADFKAGNGGDSATLIEKSITENGTYSAVDDEANGYSKVTVNVSGNSVFSTSPLNFSVKTNLEKITIPDGVTQIAGASFNGYTALTDVTIPGSVIMINEGAFGSCTALTNVTILDGVRDIQAGAFVGCTSLKTITIPASVTDIAPGGTFSGCTSLETIIINKPEGSISGAPWSAPSTTQIIWNG